jgi:hypothetical protein
MESIIPKESEQQTSNSSSDIPVKVEMSAERERIGWRV